MLSLGLFRAAAAEGLARTSWLPRSTIPADRLQRSASAMFYHTRASGRLQHGVQPRGCGFSRGCSAGGASVHPGLISGRSRLGLFRRFCANSEASTGSAITRTHPTRSDYFFYLFGASVAAGGVAVLSEPLWNPRPDVHPVTVVRLQRPLSEFHHPYNDRPWYWRWWFRLRRGTFLVLLWLPCGLSSIVVWATGSKTLRERWLELLVSTLEYAGCSFQKFGQWLSMRPDILPQDVIDALSRLRDDTPPHSIAHTRTIFKESFGCDIEEIFEWFEEEPIASASVGQVHRARLRPQHAMEGGVVDVAVKIRHPRVIAETFIDSDLIFSFMENSGGLLVVPFEREDFIHLLQKQFDFEWEAYNMSRFAENFQSETSSGMLAFPQVSGDLLAPCVLVESWAQGKTVASIFTQLEGQWKVVGDAFSDSLLKTKKELARVLFDMNMKMFLRDNFIHGDLHAGNILYDADTNRVTVLDAGLITEIEEHMMTPFVLFMQAMCGGDAGGITEALVAFDSRLTTPEGRDEAMRDPVNQDALRATVQKACDHWVDPVTGMDPNGGPISVGDLMGEIMFGMRQHGVLMNSAVASTLLTISISEGLIRSLDPDFDMITNSFQYLARYSGSELLRPVVTVAADKVGDEVTAKADQVTQDAVATVERVKDDAVATVEQVKEEVATTTEGIKEKVENMF